MKNIILIMSLFASFSAMAEQKAERVIELKNHVNKMTLQGNKTYRLELRESAAAYYADEKFAPCLKKSIAENKTATLKVAAYSLNILECKN